MIDFKYTEEQNGIITFVNEKGETVKTYPLSELEQYVKDTFANLTYEHVSEYSGNGDSNDPRNWDGEDKEVYEPINEYIDSNWYDITEKFYNAKNPTEYQAKNRIQETRKALR